MGRALSAALASAGVTVRGPLGRGDRCEHDPVVLLCVPDREIAAAAVVLAPGRLVGHCSGATTLAPLAPHEAFSVHPLMTVTGDGDADFSGAGCAIAGSTPRALDVARAIAERLRMRPVQVRDADRVLYHAAAAMASNFLTTLEQSAAGLAEQVGVPREMLLPLMQAALDRWADEGAHSLTGPISRGDMETVARQRAAVAERAPELLPLWDAFVERTTALARAVRETP